MNVSKVAPDHLNRRACVYVRQSTMVQVTTNKESTARQYALRDRALSLGWAAESIEVIDEDLGHSGQSTAGRPGIQRLAEEVALCRVGALFALEVSRLARSSADWYRLLELCSIADVLLIDECAIYRPHADYNDRMLLGFKGQMGEAELHWMRLRLHGAKLAKARRGQARFPMPAGLVWQDDRIVLHPDQSVRSALSLVFERFRVERSARACAYYLQRQGVRLPVVADTASGALRWVVPRPAGVLDVLHHPMYAGAYAFGRGRTRLALVDGHVRARRTGAVPLEEWPVLIRDHHPGYLSWDEFMTNQKTLRANRTLRHSPDQRGAAREGAALLQGLVLCGRCGRRMYVYYSGRTPRGQYRCQGDIHENATGGPCWSTACPPVDAAVEAAFLGAIQPPELDLSLAVAHRADGEAAQLDRQWQMRIERARYDVRQAERRYRAVDSDNRLVARTLERDWEEKLHELAEVERDYEEARRHGRVALTDRDREAIRALARDLPAVWRAPTTTPADRKNLLRMALQETTLRPVDVPARAVNVQLIWKTGHTTALEIPAAALNWRLPSPPEALALIRDGAANGRSDRDIAADLERRGLRTATGMPWTAGRVARARAYRTWQKPLRHDRYHRLPARRDDGTWSVRGLAERTGQPQASLYRWIRTGQLRARRDPTLGMLWVEADDRAVERLRAQKTARASLPRGGRTKAAPEVVEFIRQANELRKTDRQIARELGEQGHLTGSGSPWTPTAVRGVRAWRGWLKRRKPGPRLPSKRVSRKQSDYTSAALARRLGIDISTVYDWRDRGHLEAFRDPSDGTWRFRADNQTLARLKRRLRRFRHATK